MVVTCIRVQSVLQPRSSLRRIPHHNSKSWSHPVSYLNISSGSCGQKSNYLLLTIWIPCCGRDLNPNPWKQWSPSHWQASLGDWYRCLLFKHLGIVACQLLGKIEIQDIFAISVDRIPWIDHHMPVQLLLEIPKNKEGLILVPLTRTCCESREGVMMLSEQSQCPQ